jgi:hypothetical protein
MVKILFLKSNSVYTIIPIKNLNDVVLGVPFGKLVGFQDFWECSCFENRALSSIVKKHV